MKKYSPHKDRNDQKWEMQYFELKKYKRKHGHCDVSATDKGYQRLYEWVLFQRRRKKRMPGKYEPDRIRKLNEIGFCWSILDKWFEQHFRLLEKYYKKHGHCNVSEFENKALAKWCGHLRDSKKGGFETRLTPQRVNRLNALGFKWVADLEEQREKIWLAQFAKLREFKKQHGHCNVPEGYKDMKLHRWCLLQRKYKRRGKYTIQSERVNKLNFIGFTWEPHDVFFEKNLAELKKYKEKHGHCNVLLRENRELAEWRYALRNNRKLKKPSLTPERINKLTTLGFEW